MPQFLRAVTPTGQRVAIASANLVIVSRFVDDKPVLGESVAYVPGLPPLVLKGTVDDIVAGREPAPELPLVIPSDGTNEA